MKKCPPGVICIENMSMIMLVICVFIILYLIYNNFNRQNVIFNNNNNPSGKIVIKDTQRVSNGWLGGLIPSWPYNNLVTQDTLFNPYAPPLRDER